MKKLLFLLLAMVGLTSCHIERTVKEGHQVTDVRRTQPFERIEVNGVCDVHFIQGDSFSVRVVGTQEAVEHTKTQYGNGTLSINTDGEIRWFGLFKQYSAIVYVVSPDLVGLTMRGVGDFVADKPIDTDTLNVFLKGVGDVKLGAVVCDEFFGTLIGTGDLKIDGLKTQRAVLNLKGTGDMDAFFDSCGVADCSLQGVGDMTLSGTVGSLKKNVRGTGDINEKDLRVYHP